MTPIIVIIMETPALFATLRSEDVHSLPLPNTHGIAFRTVAEHFALTLRLKCFRGLLKCDLLMYHDLKVTLLVTL